MKVAMPEGHVTFVFTDIEGSTRLLRRLGDDYGQVLERHNVLLRREFSIYGGREIRNDGDGFFVAFGDVTAALDACVASQRALQAEPWPDGSAVRVRIGVHAGRAFPRGDDYAAFAVHQAARVVATAHGGQVVVTAATAQQARMRDAVRFRSLGFYRVRDFDDPVELLQVEGPGLANDFPAVRSVPADGHNLVRPRTRLFGREVELAELDEAVQVGQLLTVTGPGGVGKTRLMAEWALRAAGRWPDGVWMVDLASIDDATLASAVTHDALGIASATYPNTVNVAELAGRQLVLILDNCEHLVGEHLAAFVCRLLETCPFAALVATSRQLLGVDGEHVWRLDPLPPIAAGSALFVDRARTAVRNFTTTDADLNTIGEICQRLDGLPLAIELAASRVDKLTLNNILEGVAANRRLLHTRNRTAPERLLSLEATLRWSWQLLDDVEQAGLAALGLFATGFDLATASAAMGNHATTAEIVWSLVDKSLIVADPTSPEGRYRCLATIRQYALDRLEERGETLAAATRLANAFLHRFGPQHQALDHSGTLDRAIEIDNVRALIPILAVADAGLAQALACTIMEHNYAAYGAQGLDEGLALVRRLTAPSPYRLSLLVLVACQWGRNSQIDTWTSLITEATALRDELGGEAAWDEMAVDHQLGFIALTEGRPRDALDIAERSLERVTTPRGHARRLNLLAAALGEAGDVDGAICASREGLAVCVERGAFRETMIAHNNLAFALCQSGQLVDAARHQLSALEMALQLSSQLVIAASIQFTAIIASKLGRWAEAVPLHSCAENALDRINAPLTPGVRAEHDEFHRCAVEALGHETQSRLRLHGAQLELELATDIAIAILTGMA